MDIELGKRLRAWRDHRGMTLREVAAAAGGVTMQAIALAEGGETTDMLFGTVYRICTLAFRIGLDTFMGVLPVPEAVAAVARPAPAKQERRRGR